MSLKYLVGSTFLALTLTTPVPSPQQVVVVPDEETCPDCAIEVVDVVRIRSNESGPVLVHPYDVEVDARGRFWALFPNTAAIAFGSDGQFLQAVARRGEGPGELNGAYRLASAENSMVVIGESGMANAFGMEFEFLGRTYLGVRGVRSAAIIQWPETVMIAARSTTPQGIGFPLHLLDASSNPADIEKSFGFDTRGEYRPGEVWLWRDRYIWNAGDVVVVGEYLQYRVSMWSHEGERLSAFVRRPSWFSGTSDGLKGLSDRPPSPAIAAVSTDESGQLWVFTHVAVEDWQQPWIRTEEQFGKIPEGAREVPGRMVPPGWELWATMIEVIDPDNGRVVVRHKLDEYVIHVLADGRVVTYDESDDLAATSNLQVHRLRLRR